mmetsp:Transcript_33651/g.71212  ORF Transcript_33651/g.71212 Transcript_33651/m.71212 type:complete len:682 (-) Transcript_33651:115-2160(-)
MSLWDAILDAKEFVIVALAVVAIAVCLSSCFLYSSLRKSKVHEQEAATQLQKERAQKSSELEATKTRCLQLQQEASSLRSDADLDRQTLIDDRNAAKRAVEDKNRELSTCQSSYKTLLSKHQLLESEILTLTYGGPPRLLVEVWAVAGNRAAEAAEPTFVGEQWLPAIDELKANLKGATRPQFQINVVRRLLTSRPDPSKPDLHSGTGARDVQCKLYCHFEHHRQAVPTPSAEWGHLEQQAAKEVHELLAQDVYAFRLLEAEVRITGALPSGSNRYIFVVHKSTAGNVFDRFFATQPLGTHDGDHGHLVRFSAQDQFTMSVPRVPDEVYSRVLDLVGRLHSSAGDSEREAQRHLATQATVVSLQKQLAELSSERVSLLREIESLHTQHLPDEETRLLMPLALEVKKTSAEEDQRSWFQGLLLKSSGIAYENALVVVRCTATFDNSEAGGCSGLFVVSLSTKGIGPAFASVNMKCHNPDRVGMSLKASPIEPDESTRGEGNTFAMIRQRVEVSLVTKVDAAPRVTAELSIGNGSRPPRNVAISFHLPVTLIKFMNPLELPAAEFDQWWTSSIGRPSRATVDVAHLSDTAVVQRLGYGGSLHVMTEPSAERWRDKGGAVFRAVGLLPRHGTMAFEVAVFVKLDTRGSSRSDLEVRCNTKSSDDTVAQICCRNLIDVLGRFPLQ